MTPGALAVIARRARLARLADELGSLPSPCSARVVTRAGASQGAAAEAPVPDLPGARATGTSAWTSCRVHPRSAAIVAAIGRADNAHADFGSGLYEGGPIGIPYTRGGRATQRARAGQLRVRRRVRPRPLPDSAQRRRSRAAARSDGDRHVIVVDRSRCRLYELFAAYPENGGRRWRAGSGAIWNLRSNRLRPRGWTSADAAGLPILPGLARYDEVKRGRDRPRAAHHRAAHPAGVHLPGAPLRLRLDRPEPAGDGPAPAAASAASTSRASRARRGSCCGR